MTLAEFGLPETVENVSGGPRIPTPRLVTHYRQHWRQEPCVYCGITSYERHVLKKMMTKEHIAPLSTCVGGEGRTWENIATACMKCNTERGNMPLLHFLVLKSYQLVGGQRLTKKQRRAMGFRHPQPKLDKLQAVCHSNGIKEMDMTNSNAVRVNGGFIGGIGSHWNKSTLAAAQESHAATKRLTALDLHAGEQ